MTKIAGFGSTSPRHGSADPDPDPHQQNKGLCGLGERGGDAEIRHAVPAGRSANRFEPVGASSCRRGGDQTVHVRH
jgi:hypothetical protein